MRRSFTKLPVQTCKEVTGQDHVYNSVAKEKDEEDTEHSIELVSDLERV
jgi:hypothetical protein